MGTRGGSKGMLKSLIFGLSLGLMTVFLFVLLGNMMENPLTVSQAISLFGVIALLGTVTFNALRH